MTWLLSNQRIINRQIRRFKYIGTKSLNNIDPVIKDKFSLIAFKSSHLKEYFNQP